MGNRKLEMKIITDTEGNDIDLTNLSIHSAKSLKLLLDSLINIIEATSNANDIKIGVTKGSATLTAIGTETTIGRLETDFQDVVENKSTNRDIVNNWKNIQQLISLNKEFIYEINFYKADNTVVPILSKLDKTKAFRTKVQRKPKEYTLIFLKGELIVNGGHSPNLHIQIDKEEKIVHCEREIAKELNKHLYGNIYVVAWGRKVDETKFKYTYCDSYLTEDLFNEYKTFIENNSDLTESDEYVLLHEKIKDYIDSNDFGKLRKLLRLYNHESADLGSLKTILLTTKEFKENDKIKDLRISIKKIFDSKLKKRPN